MKRIALIAFVFFFLCNVAFPPKALQASPSTPHFTTDRHFRSLVKSGFDSEADLNDWKITASNQQNTWKVGDVKKSNLKPFSSVNPDSKASLVIYYDDNTSQDEWIASPEVTSSEPLRCSFYSAFDGAMAIFASFTLYVEDVATGEREKLFNSFDYSQETGHERHQWLFFSFDLGDQYRDKKVRFLFQYKGLGGDDVYIDDFQVGNISQEAVDPVTLVSGEQVTFYDMTQGDVEERVWEFPGGEPANSTAENPLVTYSKVGEYDVILTVKLKNETEKQTLKRERFVKVQSQLPKARINYPEVGYFSPHAWTYLPGNEWIEFKDASQHEPTAWQWSFPDALHVRGADTSMPSVLYDKKGTYDVSLQVSNDVGSSRDDLKKAIQIAGEAEIWNIEPEVSATMDVIGLGWYGYYGGSNFLDIIAFAEKMHAPAKPLTIESIVLYFGMFTPIDTEGTFAVALYSVGEDGLPKEPIAEESVPLSNVVFDPDDWKATEIPLKEAVVIDKPFFVVVKDIPSRTSSDATKIDEIVLGAVRRDADSPIVSHVYHLLKQEADELQWYENNEENSTLAIAVKGYYPEPVENQTIRPTIEPLLTYADGWLILPRGYDCYFVTIAQLTGEVVKQFTTTSSVLPLVLPSGSYVVKVEGSGMLGTAVFTNKIISSAQ